MQSGTKKQSIMGTWSRSAAVACVALMLCFIDSSAFATTNWIAATGSWGTPRGSVNANWSNGIVPNDTEQVKILGGNTCTLDVDAGTFTTWKVTVGTSATEGVLNVVSGGSLTSVVEIQVGDALKYGRVTQTGGTINLNGISSRDSKLEVGYKTGVGYYTISGGSITSNSYSQLLVGASGASGGAGTFTVQGTGGSISVSKLYVGASDSIGTYQGSGTLAFEINGGVSAINAGSIYIDPTNAVSATANLIVTKTGDLPAGDIILIKNTGVNAVTGAFDNAAWDSTITLDGIPYTLTNTYIGGLDGLANDVALLMPPAPGKASDPSPTDGSTDVRITPILSWTAGSDATSHDVYFGTVSPGTFQGNQAGTTFNPGTLTNATTYYWRIDEKNVIDTTTGDVWSFTTIVAVPGKASNPTPSDWATDVGIIQTLSWTAGSGATSHDVYFGTVSPGTFQGNQAGTTFNPGTLTNATTYYWRIDEKNVGGTVTGDVWSFTIIVAAPGKASDPSPTDGSTDAYITPTLSWTAGSDATSHDVYFGTVSPGTFLCNQADTTFDPGALTNATTYYWRIDEKNVGGMTTGDVWSFTPYCNTYFVDPNGNDTTGDGSIGSPFKTIPHAAGLAVAGDTIYVRGGSHTYTTTINLWKNGTAYYRFYLFAYPGERPVLDFSGMADADNNRGIKLTGSYWYIKGLDIYKAGDNGMIIQDNASYNRIELCNFYENLDSGLQLDNGAAYNEIINCDSYYNEDSTQGNSDGFSPKLTVGTGNYFYGCRSWNNSDDAYDCYLNAPTDNVTTTFENCWAIRAGYLKDKSAGGGNGNGFKMGSANGRHNIILKNCLAFENLKRGFDQNNNKGSMTLYNCTAFNNLGDNYSIYEAVDSGYTAEIVNCINYIGEHTYGGDNYSINVGSFVTQITNSWQSPFVVSRADFISINPSGAIGPRNVDGSLPDITFMHLTAGSDLLDAGTDVDLPYSITKPDLGCFEYSAPPLTIRTCTVTAGKTQASDAYLGQDATDINNIKDSFTASGTAILPRNLEDITNIGVDIVSGDGNVIYSEIIDFNYYIDVRLKRGIYSYSHRITKAEPRGAITSLKMDFRMRPVIFAIAATNINLTGLACLVEMDFVVDGNLFWGYASEAVVNGRNTLIPTRLMRLYADTLVVTKARANHSTTPSSDSLSIMGFIAVADMNLIAKEPNLVNEDVVITWGDGDGNDQNFIIPAGSFTSKAGNSYKCVNVPIAGGVISANIDLDKCTFSITVKYASLNITSGNVKFGISFETPNGDFNEEDDYTLP